MCIHGTIQGLRREGKTHPDLQTEGSSLENKSLPSALTGFIPPELGSRYLSQLNSNTRLKRKLNYVQNSLRGFTLIELVLVIFIIGLFTSLVAPAITSTTGLRLKTTTKRVAAGLRFARSQAVISGSTYRATFDLENGQVTVASLASDNPYESGMDKGTWRDDDEDLDEERASRQRPPEKKVFSMPPDVTIAQVLIDGEEIYEETAEIDFFPNGSCSGGEIFLMDSKERIYRISLEFLTGIVKIREGEEE
jgi:general secretion pathway protein H